MNIVKCEKIEDLKINIKGNDYGSLIENEKRNLKVYVIEEKISEKIVIELKKMRKNDVENL